MKRSALLLPLLTTACISEPDPLPLAQQESLQAMSGTLSDGFNALEKMADLGIVQAETVQTISEAQLTTIQAVTEALHMQAEAARLVQLTTTVLNITIVLMALAMVCIVLAFAFVIMMALIKRLERQPAEVIHRHVFENPPARGRIAQRDETIPLLTRGRERTGRR